MPYISLEYNIFCKDPFEKKLDRIEPLSISDFCDLVNYDKSNFSRLMKELKSLTFNFNDREEYLISYIDNGDNLPNSRKIFINPHIVYNGTNYHRVEILGEFCKPMTQHFVDSSKSSKTGN